MRAMVYSSVPVPVLLFREDGRESGAKNKEDIKVAVLEDQKDIFFSLSLLKSPALFADWLRALMLMKAHLSLKRACVWFPNRGSK